MTATTLPFSLTEAPFGVLRVGGEIDLASAEDFLNAMVLLADPSREVVLDISELAFIDSVGVKTLISLAIEACPHGIVIQSPRPNVQRVLGIIDVEQFCRIRVEPVPYVSSSTVPAV